MTTTTTPPSPHPHAHRATQLLLDIHGDRPPLLKDHPQTPEGRLEDPDLTVPLLPQQPQPLKLHQMPLHAGIVEARPAAHLTYIEFAALRQHLEHPDPAPAAKDLLGPPVRTTSAQRSASPPSPGSWRAPSPGLLAGSAPGCWPAALC
jgi:hypothetical protein